MPKLSMEEIGALAVAAWGSDASQDDQGASSELVTAVAVAWAESKGDTDAHNTAPPDDSYGLWQINMYGKLGPQRLKEFGLSSAGQLFEPATNARAAHTVWKSGGGSFAAWSTFRSGAYLSHVPAARRALGNDLGSPPTTDISDVLPAIADSVAAVAQAVWKTMVWVADPHNWGRVVVVGVGGALVIGALVVLAKPGASVAEAVTAAPKAAVKTAVKPVKLAAKVAT